MRTLRIAIAASVFTLLAACGGRQRTHITGGVLGRVVVYRNGVAFYERRATVEDGRLVVQVPRERVDDFLKSLTVVDPNTRKPLSVTIPRNNGGDGEHLTMTLETSDVRHADVLLTYVTEAPSWKPSYRVVVGKEGKVMLEGWAVVDNTTSEDWNGVLVGVGASSALAFRYDLWSVRQVDRDLLKNEEKFAIAPPTGLSPYRGGAPEELANFGASSDALGVSFSGSTSLQNSYSIDRSGSSTSDGGGIQGVVTDKQSGEKLAGVSVVAAQRGGTTETTLTDDNGAYKLALPKGDYVVTFYYGDVTIERSGVAVATNKLTPLYQKFDSTKSGGEAIKITSRAPEIDPTSSIQSVKINRRDTIQKMPITSRTFSSTVGAAAGSTSIERRNRIGNDFGGFDGPPPPSSSYESSAPSTPPPRDLAAEFRAQFDPIVARYRADKRDLVVETTGPSGYPAEVTKRGETLKNKLVDAGIPADKVHVVPKLVDGASFGTRVLAVNEAPKPAATPLARDLGPDTPVGESHFMADKAMTVRSGSSAMVAMLHRETTGGVVYFYDPISERGDKRFAFKAVRLDNPTGDTLEPGPVTVYGDGRFIGEGITEPVPPHAAVVVPFALDKQVVVTADNDEEDRIAKLITVQRGVLTADIQHRRNARYTVTSRLTTPSTIYLRHRLESGWTLVDAPKSSTRVGDSQLFEIVLAPGETKEVVIASATPLQRTFQLGSPEVLGMMRVFVDEPNASPQLKAQIEALLATHRAGADLDDKIATLRDQLAEYRSRSGELHAQIVTLKAVRTGGDLMTALKGKLAETSDRIQKATIAIVEAQEQMMLTRVKFQNQLAEMRLTDATAVTARPPGPVKSAR